MSLCAVQTTRMDTCTCAEGKGKLHMPMCAHVWSACSIESAAKVSETVQWDARAQQQYHQLVVSACTFAARALSLAQEPLWTAVKPSPQRSYIQTDASQRSCARAAHPRSSTAALQLVRHLHVWQDNRSTQRFWRTVTQGGKWHV
jgi:hypothetical protein